MLSAVLINQALLLNFFFKISIYLLFPLNKYLSVDNTSLVQSCCLTGAQSPEVPTISLQAIKISNKKPERMPKACDSQANFRTFETKTGNIWSSAVGKKIFLPIKGKQTS